MISMKARRSEFDAFVKRQILATFFSGLCSSTNDCTCCFIIVIAWASADLSAQPDAEAGKTDAAVENMTETPINIGVRN
jgi:hypothetical protein